MFNIIREYEQLSNSRQYILNAINSLDDTSGGFRDSLKSGFFKDKWGISKYRIEELPMPCKEEYERAMQFLGDKRGKVPTYEKLIHEYKDSVRAYNKISEKRLAGIHRTIERLMHMSLRYNANERILKEALSAKVTIKHSAIKEITMAMEFGKYAFFIEAHTLSGGTFMISVYEDKVKIGRITFSRETMHSEMFDDILKKCIIR